MSLVLCRLEGRVSRSIYPLGLERVSGIHVDLRVLCFVVCYLCSSVILDAEWIQPQTASHALT